MTKTRQRLLLLMPVALAACSYAIWRATRPGYEFPPASMIDRIEATVVRIDHTSDDVFTVPGDEYDREILAALSPSRYDGGGKKWQVMGNLTIQTADGPSFQVFLFDLDEDQVGAFAVGTTWESRRYYRGGNSGRLRIALEKARAKAEKPTN